MSSVADQLVKTLEGVGAASFQDKSDTARVKQALFAAMRRLQTPFEIAERSTWIEPTINSSVKTLIDAGFWKAWVAAGSKAATVKELASLSSIDPVLLDRLLRTLAAQHLVTQVSADTYEPGEYGKGMADDKMASMYTVLYEISQPNATHFPKFAADTKYANPVDPENTGYTHRVGKEQPFFGMLAARPEVGKAFNDSMTIKSTLQTPWVKFYPTDTIFADAKPGKALVVDVGGSAGHDLEKFRAKYPDVPEGSLILQDLPEVVEKAQIQSPCVAQGYDFFTPQPVKGARVYYSHSVLHDWPDVQAVEILKTTAGAMEKGYSKLLLHGIVIASQNASPLATVTDLIMMMSFSALERSEDQWNDLISKAGLRIVKIWSLPESYESIIEAELA